MNDIDIDTDIKKFEPETEERLEEDSGLSLIPPDKFNYDINLN